MVYSWPRAERDLRAPPGRPVGLQHIVWSCPPLAGGSDVDMLGQGDPDSVLDLVPLVNLAAPIYVSRLAIFAAGSHTSGDVPIRLSLWRADGARWTEDSRRGTWEATLLGTSDTYVVPASAGDSTVPDIVVARLPQAQLLEPPNVYYLGLQPDEAAGGSLVVRCPQGDYATVGQFLAARRAKIAQPSRLGDVPKRVAPGAEVQHFFAAGLSDWGHQHFLRGSD